MGIYEIEFEVRDYECDFQGIVNNSVYLNYLEHSRHKYLLERAINFTELHKEGIDLVVSRIEIDYKYSLTSGDKFVVRVATRREGHLRMVFEQEAIKLPEGKTVVRANVTGVAVRNGRPIRIDDIPGFVNLFTE